MNVFIFEIKELLSILVRTSSDPFLRRGESSVKKNLQSQTNFFFFQVRFSMIIGQLREIYKNAIL